MTGKPATITILGAPADPASGSARVAGSDVWRERDTVQRDLG